LKREFLTTGDGSVTIHLPEWNEQYHSKHGAIAEAQHVFIRSGLQHIQATSNELIEILEIGFGTGLNAYLTLLEADTAGLEIKYTGVEAYPVAASEITQLNYSKLLGSSGKLFGLLHTSDWETVTPINSRFQLLKLNCFFHELELTSAFHLVYFDAFGPRVQPELWTEAIFMRMYTALKPGGVLVTYSAKGSVRRGMQAVGFNVERLPGPPFKREMLRATKPS
jgi:tRNA U34 5-methylaminomethyl-2-thiouridine-forming methyltransferase MnmC